MQMLFANDHSKNVNWPQQVTQSRKEIPRTLFPSVRYKRVDPIQLSTVPGSGSVNALTEWVYKYANLTYFHGIGRIDPLRGIMHQPVYVVLNKLGLQPQDTFATIVDALSERLQPIESEFKRLAREDPWKLIVWIDDGTLKPSQLTYAAEALSLAKSPDLAVPCLLRLLTNTASLVREGAIYGLEGHLDHPGVRERLKEISINDPREGVREAATEALE